MTVLTTSGGQIGKSSFNGDPNQLDSQSTCDMIIATNHHDRLSTQKLLSITLITMTCLMGFFLLTAIYIQTNNRCVCSYPSSSPYASESQSGPYFEPLKALSSSDDNGREMPHLPLHIRMHGNAKDMMSSGSNGGRVSCEITRRTASQIIASEPKELNTPFGNITTDPKLMHLTGEKLFFTCYNGEKPKPVVVVARPRIYAIFHRPTSESFNNSSESDENDSSDNNVSNFDTKPIDSSNQSIPITSELGGPASAPQSSNVPEENSLASSSADSSNARNKREVAESNSNAMNCLCKCSPN